MHPEDTEGFARVFAWIKHLFLRGSIEHRRTFPVLQPSSLVGHVGGAKRCMLKSVWPFGWHTGSVHLCNTFYANRIQVIKKKTKTKTQAGARCPG